MLRNIIFLTALLFSLRAYTQEFEIEVLPTFADNNAIVSISTLEVFPRSCTLTIENVEIESNEEIFIQDIDFDFENGTITRGTIALTIDTDYVSECQTINGSHSQVLTLEKGETLPSVQSGTYEIIINGKAYGIYDL